MNLNRLKKTIMPNNWLFKEGDFSNEAYILLKGEVQIIKDDKVVEVITDSGCFIGEMSALLNIPRSAGAKTKSFCEFYVISPFDFEVLMKSKPEVAIKLTKSIAQRLFETTKKYTAQMDKSGVVKEKIINPLEKMRVKVGDYLFSHTSKEGEFVDKLENENSESLELNLIKLYRAINDNNIIQAKEYLKKIDESIT